MRYEIIQTKPYKNAAFLIHKNDGRSVGKIKQTHQKNDRFNGFEFEFLDYCIQMKSVDSIGLKLKKALKFWVPIGQASYYLFQNGIKCGELSKYSNGIYSLLLDGKIYTMCIVGFGNNGIKFPIFEGKFENAGLGGKQIALIETLNLAQKLNKYQVTALGEWEGWIAALYGIYVDAVTFSINDSHYRKKHLETFNRQNSLYDPAFKEQIVD